MTVNKSGWVQRGVVAAVAASVAVGGVQLAQATVSEGSRPVYVALDAPCRLVDTRPEHLVGERNTPLGAAETFDVSAHGANGNCDIPAEATALSMNVTAVNATAPTNVRIFPAGAALPTTSNLNPNVGAAMANAVVTDLDEDGIFSIFNAFGSLDVIVDINGFYEDHNHDDRYYTKTEVDTAIASGGEHDHDDRYLTEVESDERYHNKEYVDNGFELVGIVMGNIPAPTAVASVMAHDANPESYRSEIGFQGSPGWDGTMFTLDTELPFNTNDGDTAVVTPVACEGWSVGVMPDVGSVGGDVRVQFFTSAGAERRCSFSIVVYDSSELPG